MTVTIKPLARGEHRREVRIGRTGKGVRCGRCGTRLAWKPDTDGVTG